jgi:hypothetical protein
VLILLIGMSFDEDFDEWYKKNYPHEWNLKEEIETRTEQILRSMPATMPSNEIRKFELGVVLNPATNKLGIAINLTGELFLGALGSTFRRASIIWNRKPTCRQKSQRSANRTYNVRRNYQNVF